MNEFIQFLSTEHSSALRYILLIGGAIGIVLLKVVVAKARRRPTSTAKPVGGVAATLTVSDKPETDRQLPVQESQSSSSEANTQPRFAHLFKAEEYFISGVCPDRTRLALDLDAVKMLWSLRDKVKDGLDYDENMRKQNIPEPKQLLIASVFLCNQDGYNVAMKVIGDRESDAYYRQKWSGMPKEDLGEMHSASDLVIGGFEWLLSKATGEASARMMQSIERLDPKMAAALRKSE